MDVKEEGRKKNIQRVGENWRENDMQIGVVRLDGGVYSGVSLGPHTLLITRFIILLKLNFIIIIIIKCDQTLAQ